MRLEHDHYIELANAPLCLEIIFVLQFGVIIIVLQFGVIIIVLQFVVLGEVMYFVLR